MMLSTETLEIQHKMAAILEECSLPNISLDMYQHMLEDVLDSNKRYELLYGIVIEMQAISPEHGFTVKRLHDALSHCFGARYETIAGARRQLLSKRGITTSRSNDSWIGHSRSRPSGCSR